jgi:hypothetical protein
MSPEVAMNRNHIDETEWEDDDQISEGGKRQFAKRNADQPKRSPIRRKDKMRPEEEMKPKAKRNHKKVQLRIKYEWKDS